MKFIAVLFISVFVTVCVGTIAKNTKSNNNTILVSPLIAGANTSIDPSILDTKLENSIFDWQVFVNNYYGYKIKHPSDVNIKNRRNGDVSLEKQKSVNIYISQDVLNEKDTVNTVIEGLINQKNTELKDNFSLINNISPIAMSTTTAQTFTTKENEEIITYYYVPQEDRKFLMITNSSPQNGSTDFLTSEDIIYSLELLP